MVLNPASPLESPGELFKFTSAVGEGMENGCLTGTEFPFWGDENVVELRWLYNIVNVLNAIEL